ncbi:Holliday junction branch migration protein RuvA [Candidatus Peregrinibacteria bacterium]|nr:Holliday junction branch migration protein RuvA [Candidatus Peregrinibacteria bacterium]
MIAYLKGKILEKEERYLIMEVNGVGYQIFTTNSILTDCQKGQDFQLFIHTHVREDDIKLYGFLSMSELNFFNLLISVSGIGPKIGIEILSAPIAMVKNAIFTSNVAFLTNINGLGKKTAERLILELKSKVEPVLTSEGRLPHGITPGISQSIDPDAVTALESLGYNKYQIVKVLKNLDKKLEKTEDVIKYFLQNV